MDYYNEEKKKDEGGPVIGNLGASFKKASVFGKTPSFSRAAGSILERIKNLSKKDMAFVAVGMSVLVAAPVAEYMMSKPSTDNQLTSGFGQRGEGSASIYEPGINALSQGSPDGTGEVITPLSARDPASLIIGSQSSQPPTVVPTVNNTAPQTDYRDSMKDAARNAFSTASKSAGVPTVIPKMQSSLRSMGSFFSGGEGSRTSGALGGGKIVEDAKNASSKAVSRSMMGPVASAGYKGVATTPHGSSKGAFEKLRAQADKAAGNFTGGSATSALDKAAADSANIGKGDGGMGGSEGEKYRSPSGSSIRDQRSHSPAGETLAQMARKQRMQKALEWEFFKQYEIPKQMVQAMLTGFTGALTKFTQGLAENLFGLSGGPGPAPSFCWAPKDGVNCANGKVALYPMSICNKDRGINCDLGDCKCGVGPAGQDGTNPPGPNNPSVIDSSSTPVEVAEIFEGYDTVLKEMLADAEDGAEATTYPDLLRYTRETNGGFQNLGVARVVQAIRTGVTSVQTREIAAYQRHLTAGSVDLTRVKTEYEVQRRKFDRISAAADNNALISGTTVASGVSVSAANISQQVKPYLDARKAEIIALQETNYQQADRIIAFNTSALAAFNRHMGFVTATLDSVSRDYTDRVLSGAQGINTVLTALPAETNEMAHKRTLIDRFTAITGTAPALAMQGVMPARLEDGNAVAQIPEGREVLLAFNNLTPGDYRDTLAQLPLIDSPLTWRGVPKNDAYGILGGANDGVAIAAERAAWDEVSPLKKAPGREDIPENNNLAANSLLAAAMRGLVEMPPDIRNMYGDPAAAKAKLDPVKAKMNEVMTYLRSLNINIDNPTGGNNPQGDDPVNPDNQITDVTTDQLNSAYNGTFGEYNTKMGDARTAYRNLPGENSVAVASRAEYRRLKGAAQTKLTALETAWTDFQALQAQIAAADTPAKRRELKTRLDAAKARLNTAHTEFNTAVQAAATFAAAHPLSNAPATYTVTQLKQYAANAYNRIVAAYRRGQTAMTGFPDGASKSAAQAKMTSLTTLYNTAGRRAAAARDYSGTDASVSSPVQVALTWLYNNAAVAEGLARDIERLRSGSVAQQPSGRCFNTAGGCATVSSFYAVRQWRLKPITPFCRQQAAAFAGHVECKVRKEMNDDAGRLYSTAQKNAACAGAVNTVNSRFGGGLLFVNDFTSPATVTRNCQTTNWFTLEYRIEQSESARTTAEDVVAWRARNDTGSGGTGELTYSASAQSMYNFRLDLACRPVGGVWKVHSASMAVDMPVSYGTSNAYGINMSAGPPALKVGASFTHTESTTYAVNFAVPRTLPALSGAICGSRSDANK